MEDLTHGVDGQAIVLEEEGVRAALEASIPSAVVHWLMQEDRLHRLSTLGPGFPPVG